MKKQVEVKLALREWFAAVRDDSEGVHGAQLVDAVITLGLNHDYKQVTNQRVCIPATQTIGRKLHNELHAVSSFCFERHRWQTKHLNLLWLD